MAGSPNVEFESDMIGRNRYFLGEVVKVVKGRSASEETMLPRASMHNPRLRFGLQFGPLAPCSENQRVLVAINPRGPYAAVSLERHEVLCKTACLTDTHWWQNGASPLEDVKSYGECSRGKAL